jgi:hypothetical protein
VGDVEIKRLVSGLVCYLKACVNFPPESPKYLAIILIL